jgi:hypothetical protein
MPAGDGAKGLRASTIAKPRPSSISAIRTISRRAGATVSACGPNQRGSTTMTRSTGQARLLGERADDGFILIAVLWLLAALATLASICFVCAIETAVASRVPDDRLQAEVAPRAGVELTAYRALIAPKPQRPTYGVFETKSDRPEFPFGSARRPRGSISMQRRRRF